MKFFRLGTTIIDSLSTLYIMDLHEEYWEAREWVANDFTVKIGKCVSLFEATIRVLGGFFYLILFLVFL
jgi:mannosyl-oligosaccharide alpha-1,2-mannosidase